MCLRGLEMATSPAPDQLIAILRDTIVALVRRDGPDLSARQLGVFLTCYLQDGAHTVRGLAAELHVSKPAITARSTVLASWILHAARLTRSTVAACWCSAP